jgi:hypothetical protein
MNTRTQRIVAGAAMAGVLVVAWMSRRAEAADTGDSTVAFVLCTPEGSAAVEKCGLLGGPSAYQVPVGRRLIIEQVSGNCADDGEAGLPLRANIVAQTQGVTLQHGIIGVPNADTAGGLIPLTLTRIYADTNSSVTIDVGEVPAFANRLCRLTFSGQLVK